MPNLTEDHGATPDNGSWPETPVAPGNERVAIFGGVYSNAPALEALIVDAKRRGATRLYCLGDLGGFGPFPDQVFPLLQEHGIPCVQGNYDHSIGFGLDDCGCGYTDPRDNHFAQISYDYTLAHTSEANRAWLRALPTEIRETWGGRRVLMAHGSPRRTNEFLWESTSPDHFLEGLLRRYEADVLLVTHTGLHWTRELPAGGVVINVGAIGRPANDGARHVHYALVEYGPSTWRSAHVPLAYDVDRLVEGMRSEGLPPEFIETVETGWWTTCMEILPARERQRGRY